MQACAGGAWGLGMQRSQLLGLHALVTAGGDNLAVAWDAESGACTNVIEGHSGPVTCIALTRKARHVLNLTFLPCMVASPLTRL